MEFFLNCQRQKKEKINAKKGYVMNPKIGLILYLFCLWGKMGLEFLKFTH